jgi:hypothetical protein
MPPGMGIPTGPPMPGMGLGMPVAAPPKANLIKLNKPELKTNIKIKAFVWKRIILDREKGDG